MSTATTYTVREQLERLARRVLDGRSDGCPLCAAAALCPHLSRNACDDLFEALVQAVELRDGHGGGQQGVDEALDALTGGAK